MTRHIAKMASYSQNGAVHQSGFGTAKKEVNVL